MALMPKGDIKYPTLKKGGEGGFEVDRLSK
jgi:hypothetical protein